MALREDYSIERVVEFDVHFHARPVALHIETGDLGHHAEHITDDAEL